MKKWYNILLSIMTSMLYLVVIALWIAIPEEMTLNIAVTAVALGLTGGWIYLNRDGLSIYYQSHHFKKLQESLVFFFLLFVL